MNRERAAPDWDPSRTAFIALLRRVGVDGQGAVAWRTWVGKAAAAFGTGPQSEERNFVQLLTDLLDANAANAADFERLRSDLLELLDAVDAVDDVERLARVVDGKVRLIKMLGRHLGGVVSRTSFVSFVNQQGWAPETSMAILSLDREGLQRLLKATELADWRSLCDLVG
jgi:hypothetical protein